MSNGKNAVLKIRKIVVKLDFHRYPVDSDTGSDKLTNFPMTIPKIAFTKADVAVIAY